MPDVGVTAEPTSSQEWFGGGQPNQMGQLVTMPEKGRVTKVGVWAAGKDAGASAVVVLWRGSDGAVLRQSDAFTMTGKAFAVGASDKYEKPLTSHYDAAANEQLFVGFSRNPSHAVQNGYDAGGAHRHHTTSSWPATLAGSDHAATIGAYLVYELVGEGVYVRRAGVWIEGDGPYVRRSGVWVQADVKVRRAGVWVDPT